MVATVCRFHQRPRMTPRLSKLKRTCATADTRLRNQNMLSQQYGPVLLRLALHFCAIGCCLLTACTDYAGLGKEPPGSGPPSGTYSWHSFFNNGCGPAQTIWLSREGAGELIYHCADGSKIRQSVRRYKTEGSVQLWAAEVFSSEQLQQLSASKCQAALIYRGPEAMTIKYPCALVHLTVSFVIDSTVESENRRLLRIHPTDVLITYPDGLQEFEVQQDLLVPVSPFRPFSVPVKPPRHTSQLIPTIASATTRLHLIAKLRP